jgi:hypothetical protein
MIHVSATPGAPKSRAPLDPIRDMIQGMPLIMTSSIRTFFLASFVTTLIACGATHNHFAAICPIANTLIDFGWGP